MNQSTYVGRLTKELDIKETKSGTKVLPFDIAVQRDFKNSNGEYDTDFISCLAFNKTAEFLVNYAKKGYLIGVEGRMQNNNYEREDGSTNYGMQLIVKGIDTSILFLNKGKGTNEAQDTSQSQRGQSNAATQSNTQPSGSNPFSNANGPIEIQDDDLPF